MDRERAETFLRLLAEAELRRLAEQPGDLAVQAGCITRVIRAARVLTAVRALGDEVAGQVLDDFELALVRRQTWPHVPHGRGLRWLMRSAPPRRSPAAPRPDRGHRAHAPGEHLRQAAGFQPHRRAFPDRMA